MSRKKEEFHEMRAQILNLRSAGIMLATALNYFPPCGRADGCNRKCPEASIALQELYETMSNLMFSVRLALEAVFVTNPEPWDLTWISYCNNPYRDDYMADFARSCFPDQYEFIKCWGQMVNEMMDNLGTGFSKKEWKTLTANGAWQNGRRLSQVLGLLKSLERQVGTLCDLFKSILRSSLIGDWKLCPRLKAKETAVA